jgi:hypothetical protein
MYIGLMLALASLVGVFLTDSIFLIILPSILVYFMWGMHVRIKELETRLGKSQQPPSDTSQS